MGGERFYPAVASSTLDVMQHSWLKGHPGKSVPPIQGLQEGAYPANSAASE